MKKKQKIILGSSLLGINALIIVLMYTIPFRYHREVNLPIAIEAEPRALFFLGYVRCPTICPTTLQALAKIYQEEQEMPPLFFVNLEEASPQGVTAIEYVQLFHPSFKAWQPDEKQRIAILNEFSAFYAKEQPSINRAASHSSSIYFLLKKENKWYIEALYAQYPPQIPALKSRIANFLQDKPQ